MIGAPGSNVLYRLCCVALVISGVLQLATGRVPDTAAAAATQQSWLDVAYAAASVAAGAAAAALPWLARRLNPYDVLGVTVLTSIGVALTAGALFVAVSLRVVVPVSVSTWMCLALVIYSVVLIVRAVRAMVALRRAGDGRC